MLCLRKRSRAAPAASWAAAEDRALRWRAGRPARQPVGPEGWHRQPAPARQVPAGPPRPERAVQGAAPHLQPQPTELPPRMEVVARPGPGWVRRGPSGLRAGWLAGPVAPTPPVRVRSARRRPSAPIRERLEARRRNSAPCRGRPRRVGCGGGAQHENRHSSPAVASAVKTRRFVERDMVFPDFVDGTVTDRSFTVLQKLLKGRKL